MLSKTNSKFCLGIAAIVLLACFGLPFAKSNVVNTAENSSLKIDSVSKVIHVFVALCDNKYQGIVPVPAKIGNGQDPYNNLYWGCAYGIKTFFKNSADWKLLKTQKLKGIKLERLVLRHATQKFYLIADAYDGQYIQQCIKDFLSSCSGQMKDTVLLNDRIIPVYGNSVLLSYIGHNGLMDFQLSESFINSDKKNRDCIILACASKNYFTPHLKSSNINLLLWTTGLMCPEAYTLYDALVGYIRNETNEQIRTKAASAYSNYQKCSVKSARNLLVTGW